jgi:hypothetical protein
MESLLAEKSLEYSLSVASQSVSAQYGNSIPHYFCDSPDNVL